MSMNTDVQKGDRLIVHHQKLGFVRAEAVEEKDKYSGLALLRVYLTASALPGISEAVINVNDWDVYQADDPEVLKLIASKFVPGWEF